MMQRRQFVQSVGAAGALGAMGTGSPVVPARRAGSGPKVVVVGGGYGGATAAKYIRAGASHRCDAGGTQ